MSEAGKEYGVFVKDLREQKYNRFVANILPQLKCSNEVVDIVEKDYSFCVVTRTNGAIDIYPKANKLFIRDTKKWVFPICNWLHKHILKNK